MAPISTAFVAAIERFVRAQGIPLITFRKGQRKDEVAKEHLARFDQAEGIVFVGKAQEKAAVCRTERRRNRQTRQSYARIVRLTARVNEYYFYGLDREFGPFFLKVCSYFPYNAKLYLNSHEYLKRRLTKEGIAFQALDNGLLACADPARAQAICEGLSAGRIEALLRTWLQRLPSRFGQSRGLSVDEQDQGDVPDERGGLRQLRAFGHATSTSADLPGPALRRRCEPASA